MKTYAVFFLALAITFSCSKQIKSKTIVYEGNVYIGNEAIRNTKQGIIVVLKACGESSSETCSDKFTIGQAVSDGSGHFRIEGSAARSNYYYVSVIRNNVSYAINGSGIGANLLADKKYAEIYVSQ